MPKVVEAAIDRLSTRLAGRPWGCNLIHSPYEPALEEVVDAALSKSDFEEFQRSLLLQGRSIDGVYPPNEETKKAYEEWRRDRR